MSRLKFDQVHDGDWVKPNMRQYFMKCCDCGLVHRMTFKVVHRGKRHQVWFRAWRKSKR